jgi:hypothetical protein
MFLFLFSACRSIAPEPHASLVTNDIKSSCAPQGHRRLAHDTRRLAFAINTTSARAKRARSAGGRQSTMSW